ncbi:SHOCT domain-containing protein [Pediococcus pentosaceus]|uniref:SHOCT domain-containing protein n=1 Tax=Pediococcus pentosaceus TaxID=1255 RepID=UPI00265846EB|nr:SHOCT domain-containing protein [Pediococcus pentosaceus]WKF70506.1 SHOCT domain-containing protein [Pediococcus pentosaceus]
MIENAKSIIVYKQALGYSDSENNFGLISEMTHSENNKGLLNKLNTIRNLKDYMSERRFIFSIEDNGILFMGLENHLYGLTTKSTFSNDNYFLRYNHIHDISNTKKIKLLDGIDIDGNSFNITNEHGFTKNYVQLTVADGVRWPSINSEPIIKLINEIQYAELVDNEVNDELAFESISFSPTTKRSTKTHNYDSKADNIPSAQNTTKKVQVTNNPIVINDQYVHNLFSGHNYKIYQDMWVDNVSKKVYLKKSSFQKAKLLDFKSILSYTPIEKGSHVSKHHRITRGIVGNVIAGGIGAGIGAATGGKEFDKIDELSIIINLADGSNHKIKFITGLKSDGLMAKTLSKRYYEVRSVLDSIIAENNTQKVTKDDNFEPKLTDSKVEELTHLKRLLDLDVITQTEFNKRKDEIL